MCKSDHKYFLGLFILLFSTLVWAYEDEDEEESEGGEGEEAVSEEAGEAEGEAVAEAVADEGLSIIPEGTLAEKGKRIIELNRCFVCHEIEGVSELLPVSSRKDEPTNEFEKLLNDVRCMTCHNIQGNGGTFAPELTHEGSKLKGSWIKGFIESPDIIRPLLKQMPKFNLSKEEAELAVEFIETVLISDEVQTLDITPDEAEVAKGKEIFYAKGCQTCHTVGSEGGVVGPSLNQAGTRLEPGFIMFHVKDPQKANPGAVEPNFGLSDEEATSITHFLMTLQD